jgi:hypothetical protein
MIIDSHIHIGRWSADDNDCFLDAIGNFPDSIRGLCYGKTLKRFIDYDMK